MGMLRAMEADEHLKVRTHAALALKAVPVAGNYDDHLPTVFAGSLRALQACQQGVVVPDPAQMRRAHLNESGFVFRFLVFNFCFLFQIGPLTAVRLHNSHVPLPFLRTVYG